MLTRELCLRAGIYVPPLPKLDMLRQGMISNGETRVTTTSSSVDQHQNASTSANRTVRELFTKAATFEGWAGLSGCSYAYEQHSQLDPAELLLSQLCIVKVVSHLYEKFATMHDKFSTLPDLA